MTKILVVEDDKDIRDLLVDTVTDMGLEVLEAEDGRAGLDKAISQSPDIILLDLMMPVMDGLQVLGKLKESAATKSTPVIMVSAKGQEEDVAKAVKAGAWSYLTKPWEYGELESTLASAEQQIQLGRTSAV